MKKLLGILCFSAICFSVQAQTPTDNNGNPCGTWDEQPEIVNDWITVDTVGYKPGDTLGPNRNWVMSEPKLLSSSNVNAVFCPCGCYPDTKWEDFRVDALTGIRQRRTRIIKYKYLPAPKSPYDKAIDDVKANKNKKKG